MPWKPGQSGNPRGRPSKARSLSSILETAGSASIEVGGKRIASKRLVARLLWEIATTGRCTMPDGRTMTAGPGGWLDVVKFVYGQVDGPPPREVNLGGQAENPLVIVNWDETTNEEGDAE